MKFLNFAALGVVCLTIPAVFAQSASNSLHEIYSEILSDPNADAAYIRRVEAAKSAWFKYMNAELSMRSYELDRSSARSKDQVACQESAKVWMLKSQAEKLKRKSVEGNICSAYSGLYPKEPSQTIEPATITLMTIGDTGCWLDLKKVDGTTENILGAFELCEQTHAVGTPIIVSIVSESVPSAACEGAVPCIKTDLVNYVPQIWMPVLK